MIILPPCLKKGDKIGIAAPSGAIDYPDDITDGLTELAGWGLEIIEGKTPSLRHFQYAGTDQQRIEDVQYMLDHPEIKAIIAVRGGYGCSRIVDKLNFGGFRKHPKWIIGFSDVTLLLCHIEKMGYAGIHGPMLKQMGRPGSELATASLRKILFGEPVRYEVAPHAFNRSGAATGNLIGGNLCLLAHSIGSRSEVDTRHKILFLEDVGEPLYNLDRMMWQIRRAGKLKKISGLIVGQFTESKGTRESFGQDAYEIIRDHIREYQFPAGFDFPIGHVPDNRPLTIGKTAEFRVSDNSVIRF